MFRTECKYCLISTSYLAGLFGINFSCYFIFDRIVCVFLLVTFHFVMLIIRNLNLISIQSWTYLSPLSQE